MVVNMIDINNFIINSDFASERVLTDTYTITYTRTASYYAGRQLIGYARVTVPSGDYIISTNQSSTYSSRIFPEVESGQHYIGLTLAGTEMDVYSEVFQETKTTIRMNIYVEMPPDDIGLVPAGTITAKVRLSYLPINW